MCTGTGALSVPLLCHWGPLFVVCYTKSGDKVDKRGSLNSSVHVGIIIIILTIQLFTATKLWKILEYRCNDEKTEKINADDKFRSFDKTNADEKT